MSLPSQRALREAADWFASLADGGADEGERSRWRDWLAAHPEHAEAWRRVESVTQALMPLAGTGVAARTALEAPRAVNRRKALRALALMLAAGGGVLCLSRLQWREWQYALALHGAYHRAAPGETRACRLADGGRIWLGGRGALDIDYGGGERRLALYRGDLLVETAPDIVSSPRPFVVDTRHGRLRALGTRFAVRAEDRDTRLDVFEGRVELLPARDEQGRRVVAAGEHAIFDETGVTAGGLADSARSVWTKGVLLADGMRLDVLLAEISHWHGVRLSQAPEVAGLRVVGTYPLADLEAILAALQDSLPVTVERSARGVRIGLRS